MAGVIRAMISLLHSALVKESARRGMPRARRTHTSDGLATRWDKR
jgi:hypothetical protein